MPVDEPVRTVDACIVSTFAEDVENLSVFTISLFLTTVCVVTVGNIFNTRFAYFESGGRLTIFGLFAVIKPRATCLAGMWGGGLYYTGFTIQIQVTARECRKF